MEVNWDTWTPQIRANLLFVVRGGEVLLIRKKRGLGAGKINGPGGRLEDGESIISCAVREAQEELGITPLQPEKIGELQFQFVDGYSIHVHVFRSADLSGTPVETEEAIPIWASLDNIPYDEMWEDDEIWLPLMIAGTPFKGRFIFDDDNMLDHEMEILDTRY